MSLSKYFLAVTCLATLPVLACGGSQKPSSDDAVGQAQGRALSSLPLTLSEEPTNEEVDETLRVMESELERAHTALAEREEPPYFMAYQVTDRSARSLEASAGALVQRGEERDRMVDVDVRVGSHALDNTHELRGQPYGDYESWHQILTPWGEPLALKRALWRRTDQRYAEAVERFMEVRANEELRVAAEDDSPDFARAEPVQHVEPLERLEVDLGVWADRIKSLSEIPQDARATIDRLQVSLSEEVLTRYQVTTEGARVRKSRRVIRVGFWASSTAPDGMTVWLYDSVDVFEPSALPEADALRRRIEALVDKVQALREAPTAEPYVGPAILDNEAAGVFFHEALGHRVEGHRQRDEDEGQTFARKLGQMVLPPFLSVFDDPRAMHLGQTALMGHYLVDDEAIPARRATIVKDGVLEGFLLSRKPVRGFDASNGHGRREPGKHVVARQGNLVLQPSRVVDPDTLKAQLIREIKAQGLEYGLRIAKVRGGYTITGRGLPQSFRLLPLLVYRVYPDGREELVRGANFDGTPLTVLSEIVAAADDFAVFNGVCGAESGHVPVSSVSPSLLVRRVETTRQSKGADRPPILSPPELDRTGDDR